MKPLPPLNLYHLDRMAGPGGYYAKAHHGSPDPEGGYRAFEQGLGLSVASLLASAGRPNDAERAADVSLRWNGQDDDQFGIAFWRKGLSELILSMPESDLAQSAIERAESLLPMQETIDDLVAQCVWSLHEPSVDFGRALGRKLLNLYRENRQPEWRWFDAAICAYGPVLPQALFRLGVAFEQPEWIETATEALDFLVEFTTSSHGFLMLYGDQRRPHIAGSRAHFDQLTIEAAVLATVCWEYYRATGYQSPKKHTARCFDWFHGENELDQALYDPEHGSVADAITETGVSLDRSARSTLAYLAARLYCFGE